MRTNELHSKIRTTTITEAIKFLIEDVVFVPHLKTLFSVWFHLFNFVWFSCLWFSIVIIIFFLSLVVCHLNTLAHFEQWWMHQRFTKWNANRMNTIRNEFPSIFGCVWLSCVCYCSNCVLYHIVCIVQEYTEWYFLFSLFFHHFRFSLYNVRSCPKRLFAD